MGILTLRFDIEPVAKERPRVTRFGVYTPKKTAQFEKRLKLLAAQLYKDEPLTGALGIAVTFVIPRPKSVRRVWPTARPDLDNYLKALKDALNLIVWKDDSQIVRCFMQKEYALAGEAPYINLVVEGVPE